MALTQEEFIKRAKIKHNYVYDYSLVNYVSTNKKVIIICKKHGEFSQLAQNHLKGHGCFKCNKEAKLFPKEEFINKAKEIHKDKYIYDYVTYT